MAKKNSSFFDSRRGMPIDDDTTLYPRETNMLNGGKDHTSKVIDVGEEEKEKYIKEVGVQLDSLKEKIEPLKERLSAMNRRGVSTEKIDIPLGRTEGFLRKIDTVLGSTFDLDKTAKISDLISEIEERISGTEQLTEDMEKLHTPPPEKFSSLTAALEELREIIFKKKGDEKNGLEEEIKQFASDLQKENARRVKIKPDKLVKLFAGFPERLAELKTKIESLENDEAAQELKTDDEQKKESYEKAKTDLANFAEDVERNSAKEYFLGTLKNMDRMLGELFVSIKEDGPLAFGKKLNYFNNALESAVKLVTEFKEKNIQYNEALKVFDVFVREVERLSVLKKFQNEGKHLEDILENLFKLRNSRGVDVFRVELSKFNSLSEAIADKVAEAVLANLASIPAETIDTKKANIDMRLENAEKRVALFSEVITANESVNVQREVRLLFIKINSLLSKAANVKDNILEFDQKIAQVGELLTEIIALVKDETTEEFNKQWEHMKKRTSKTPDASAPEPAGVASTPDTSSDKVVLEQAAKLQQCKTQLSFLENLPQDKVGAVLKKKLKNRVKTIKGQITKANKEADSNTKEGLLKNIQDSIFNLFNDIKNSSEGPELLKNLAGLGVDFTVAPDAVLAVPDVVASVPDTVLTVSADAEDKKEIEGRREMVELREKNFLRHIIDTMSGGVGLAQEIQGVHKILKDALKNIHDADKFEELLNQYEQQAPLLIKKISDESDIITVDSSDIVESLDRKVIEKREQEVLDCENELEAVMDRAEKGLSDYNFNDELDEIDDQIKLALASTADPNEFETHITTLRESVAQLKNSVDEMLAPKKSFWAKTKEKLFGIKEKAVAVKDAVVNKEVGKAVAEVAYNSVTSVLGVKIVADGIRWLVKGDGDLADYFKGKKRAGKDQKDINNAYQNLLTSFEKSKKGEDLSDDEQVPKRIEELKAKIENTNLSAEAKKQVLERLWAISIKHQEDNKKVVASRDKEVTKLLDGYVHSKVEGIKIAKDALNFALTATGLSLLRGVMYAGTSLLEKARKGSKEFAQKTSGTINAESENTFVKNAFIKSAQETVRAIFLRGATEGASGKTRVIDFVKAVGVVARVFGIGKLAFIDGDHNQTINQVIQGVEKNGWTHVVTEIPHNLLVNAEKAGGMVGLDRVWNKVAGKEEEGEHPLSAMSENPENSSPLDPSDMVSRLEAGSLDPIDALVAEHNLTEQSAQYLAQFGSLKDHPGSLSRILESSHVGADIRSHFTGGEIDNLIEAGGERRAVIFEELLKADKASGVDLDSGSAMKFLESQGFSKQHLSYLSEYTGKGKNLDLSKFVEKYNPEDKKMSLALFKAMQGKENTELANAGFVRAATADRAGSTIRLKGDVVYMGLDEKGQPILSGDGKVNIVQTRLIGAADASTVPSNGTLNAEDKLWGNANVMRDMQADGTPFDGDTQNALSEFSPKGVSQFMQGEADKARFAQMGEEHIDATSKPVGSNGQEVNSFDVTHLRDKEGTPIERRTAADQSLESPVPANAFGSGPVAISESGREVLGKTLQTFEADKNIVRAERTQIPVIATSNVEVENSSVLAEEPNVSYPDGSVAPAVAAIAPETPPVEKAEAVTPTPDSEIKPVAKTEAAPNLLEMTAVQKDYVERLGKIFSILTEDGIAQKMSLFTFKNGAENRLYDAINNEPALKNFRDYFESVSNNKPSEINTQEAAQFGKLLNTYAAGDQDWYKMIEDTELRLMLDPSENLSMMANNSHSIRIWDPSKKEELFITNPKYTFVLKNGSLLKMDGNKIVDTWKNYKEALATAKASSNMNR